ncbi:MAG: outer membrane beta-barrel protein [Candidatus Desulfofervidus sp.]|nr:outer membrane beta-barrel protein [Candidatus Desulfofervidus sp.]
MALIHQKKRSIFIIGLLLLGLFFPIVAFGEVGTKELVGIRLGMLRFHPNFGVTQGYTDNAFLEHKNEKDSYWATFSPGLKMITPIGRHTFEASYRADIMRYANFGDLLNTVDHTVNTALTLDFAGGLGAKLAYDYKRSSISPYSLKEERKYFHKHAVTANIFYVFANRYKAELNYKHDSMDFKKDYIWFPHGVPFIQSDSYKKDDVSTILSYRFLPKTSLLFEFGYYNLNNVDPTGPSTDSKNYRVWVGLRWKPGAKLVGTLKGGYIARRYDEKAGGHDVDNFGLHCDLTYDLSLFDHFILKAYRDVLDTYITTKTNPYYGSNYIHTGFELTYRHDFTYKLSSSLHGLYNNDNFTEAGVYNKERTDNRGGFGASINYKIRRWLTCNLNYLYINNDSNFDVEDYRENRLMLFIATSY